MSKYGFKSLYFKLQFMTVESPSEKLVAYLDDIVKNAAKVDTSKFIRFTYSDGNGNQAEAFTSPCQLKKKSARNYFHGNLASLSYISGKLERTQGMKLEFPNTHAIKGIVTSSETEVFRKLNPRFTLMSDIIIRRVHDEYEIRKVDDVSFDDLRLEDKHSDEAVIEEESDFKSEKIKEGNVLGTRFFAPRVLSKETPSWAVGCFKDFKGYIPQNLFRGGDHDGIWDGYRADRSGLSCVKGRDGKPIAPLQLSAEPCKTTKSAFTYYAEENPHK